MMSWPTLLWVLMAFSAAAELPPDQAAIVDRLRGPILGAERVQYQATITMPVADERPLVIQAAYRIERLRCTFKITGTSGRAPFLSSPPEGSTYLWEPGSAKLTGADPVEFQPQPAAELTVDPGSPPWNFEYLGPYLFAAAAVTDPTSFAWHATGEQTDEGWQVFEARLSQPLRPTEPHAISGCRYYFDPAQEAIMKVVALDPEGQSVSQTVYSDLNDLPDGSAIPLRGTTTVSPGEAQARVLESNGDVHVTVPCAGLVITTDYAWFDTPGLRLPVSREVRDDKGRLLCSFTFYDHRIQ